MATKSSFAESVINGTYGTNKEKNKKSTQQPIQEPQTNTRQETINTQTVKQPTIKSSFADSVINGTYGKTTTQPSSEPPKTFPTINLSSLKGVGEVNDKTSNITNADISSKIMDYHNAFASRRGQYEAMDEALNELGKDDGYHFGDITKFLVNGAIDLGTKTIGTVADIGGNILHGGMQALEGGADALTYLGADINDLFGRSEEAEKLRQNARFNSTGAIFGTNKPNETIVQQNLLEELDKHSWAPEIVDDLANGVGGVGMNAALATVSGGSTLATNASIFATSYGDAMSDALNNGASVNDARLWALIDASASTLAENAFNNKFGMNTKGFAGKYLKGKFGNALDNVIKSKPGKVLFNVLKDSLEEGSEEVIETMVGNFTKSLAYNITDLLSNVNPDIKFEYGRDEVSKDMIEEFFKPLTQKETLERFIMASLTSAVYNVGAGAITNALGNNQQITQEPIQETTQQPLEQTETPQIQTNQENNTNNQPMMEQTQLDLNEANNEATQNKVDLGLEEETKIQNKNENIPETKSEDILKVTNDTVKKFNNAKNGDIFKQVEQEQGRPLRQGVKTITTATGTTKLVSKMDGSLITYEPKSNQKTLEESRERNKGKSLEQRYKEEIDFINSDKRITADAIADIETLITDLKADFNNPKNVDMFLDLVQQAATLGTTDAQALQFMSVIKKLDPQTQLDTLINLVEKSKAKGDKTFDGVELNKDLVQNVLEAGNDKAKFNKAMDELTLDLAKQASKNVTFMEKVNSWRYLSMLGNLKTHGRNMLGNGLMYGLQTFKDTVGSIGEDIYDTTAKALGGKGLTERTKTTFSSLRATKDIKNYVNNTVNDFFETQENNSKYNDSKSSMLNSIKRKRKMFNERTIIGKALNKLSDINGRLLELEDKVFSRAMTKQAMKKYLVANGIKTNADIEANPEIVGRALDYAFFQGQQATYHQDSKTAQIINDIKEKSKTGSVWTKGLGLTAEATMPFVKTPINIAKNSLEYTPIVGSLDLVNQFKNAPKEIRGAMVIDNFSKQFSGFSLAALGAYLASQGILNGSGGDSKKDKLEKDLGLANYSIRIGNSTYDLSWLAPTSVPLFEGVEIYNSLKNGGINADTLVDTLFGALDPVQDMSVFQSIERLGKAVFSNNRANMIKSVGEQTFSNYLSQFIPTLMSQLAEVTDDKKRNSYSSNTTLGKTIDQLKYKIPGLRQTLPEEVDIWGEPKKNADNILQRSFEAFISPANRKEYRIDETTKELEDLSERVGSEALPTQREKSVSVNGKTYSLDGYEFAEYEKTFGRTAKNEVDSLLKSEEYKQADDETKKKMLEAVYKYANYKYKKEYSDDNDIDYNNSQENRYALVDAFNIPYYKLESLRLSDLSKKGEKMEAIDQSGLTKEQKDAINLIQNYKYYDADIHKLINTINNSKLSKTQKQYLIDKINKNSTKGGK